MTRTLVSHTDDVPMTTGLPASWKNPLRPELFAGKHERRLGKTVGITQFGVNQVVLDPGSATALRHWHEAEDEFVFVVSGEATLVDENGEHPLRAGAFAGFPANARNAHHLVNRSSAPVTLLVVGSSLPGRETIHYPDDPLGPVKT